MIVVIEGGIKPGSHFAGSHRVAKLGSKVGNLCAVVEMGGSGAHADVLVSRSRVMAVAFI